MNEGYNRGKSVEVAGNDIDKLKTNLYKLFFNEDVEEILNLSQNFDKGETLNLNNRLFLDKEYKESDLVPHDISDMNPKKRWYN